MPARPTTTPSARRVLVGTDETGASLVVSDAPGVETRLANGIVLQEVWQQQTLPARVQDEPTPESTLGPDAPVHGAVVRMLTVPAHAGGAHAEPDLHSDPSLHVITMIEGELDVILERGTVTLGIGESIVLRDSRHDLRNRQPRPARFVYTSFPLIDGPSGG